ncbi:hypothetical protein EV421DRAFT_1746596 [Armillaria borealis]|uniref:Uncharacterized protein n=1 Tax=Armillaria borealis TaxID=47425 RepID=A0AA39M5W7_9AGAR|nr:hypothetical protein EV421DRAFT_1746596 [Armillaria borealis]
MERLQTFGYSLEDKLIKDGKWTKQQYQTVTDRVHDKAKKELHVSLSYHEQSDEKKLKICEQMAREYPILQHYSDIWPVRDILKMYLKSTSASHHHRNGTTCKRYQGTMNGAYCLTFWSDKS